MASEPKRQKTEYIIGPGQLKELKVRMLNWCHQFSIHVFLDNNQYAFSGNKFECLLAVGEHRPIDIATDDGLSAVQLMHDTRKDWIFGHITYDYKNELYPRLAAPATHTASLPAIFFFIPETVIYINRELTFLTIETFQNPDVIYQSLLASVHDFAAKLPELQFSRQVSKEGYLRNVALLREHIAAGDCYEINYCTRLSSNSVTISPLAVFSALNELSPAPFAAFYRNGDDYLMCTSPERYLKKEGTKIISQPIKGTARRDKDKKKDYEIKDQLYNDVKERAENVMIVDLVRNDLARSCEVGSVQVDELFGIYSFPQVHQMISTLSGTLKPGVPFTDAIRYSFPMGSMTGAPKYKVMQLISQYEASERGLFSGTIGYITPCGDFDFNVIIRSLFYNAVSRELTFMTGGAITYDSVAENEWDEMLLKAWAMERIFTQ